MKKKTFVISVMILTALVCSCSSLYIKPTIQAELFRQRVPGPAAVLFKAAQYIIPALGYKIEGSDPEAGTITTAAVEVKLQQGDCDCGSNLGLPVIKSNGTQGKVYFVIGVSNNELTVRAEIVPELTDLISSLGAAANIVCVSKGGLEKALARNFVNKMGESATKMGGDALRMLFK